ncbi:hypothetical protein Desti_3050 [Desulfomonile tiedjei DSM 6799]|uniref:Uncharacterized protein n=1 Tax=Desulfomonile tiedjei (strain ATCC 49306 / DSM 6799 / DCB-1) TaxID=706587 RepID=I4C823_DESTA|nr:hypothetical protein Desti_3050 [Desulfomonile tiedjei DSM 6799]
MPNLLFTKSEQTKARLSNLNPGEWPGSRPCISPVFFRVSYDIMVVIEKSIKYPHVCRESLIPGRDLFPVLS